MRTEWSTTARDIFRIAARISRTLSCRSGQWYFHSRGRRQTTISDSSCAALKIPPIPKKGENIENEEQGEARGWSGGRWRRTRAANSGRQKTKSTNERATGKGGGSYTGGSTEGRRKGTRISYKALLSSWVAEVAIVLCFDSARWTCLTFNRCVFADDDDAKAKATRQRRQQHRDFIVLPRPYFIVADCSFVSAPLHPAGRFFASSKEFFVSGPFSASLTASAESSPCRFNQNQTSCWCSEIYDRIELKLNVNYPCGIDFINYYSYMNFFQIWN